VSVTLGMASLVANDVIMRTGVARRVNDWRHVATGCTALVEFKITVLTYKITTAHQRHYFWNTLLWNWPACALHSFNQQLLQIPYMNIEFGQCSFGYCSLKIRSEIPATISVSATVVTCERRLKSHFLGQLALHCCILRNKLYIIRPCPPTPPVWDFLHTVHIIN